ncbi:MAG: polysaccharide biosynthesis C-terminal domain-containing protein [Firmicutes bacterium]|nr:polysaccharide biosynthesis C-terminal domain-containing protein [Bacillota bacterium]
MVAIPRLSFYLGHQLQDEYKRLIQNVLDYLLTCLLPVVCGLLIPAQPIMLIVGGSEYGKGAIPLSILSVALLFASLACLFSSGVLLRYKRDNVYLMATVISCLVNVGSNFIMIPLWGYNGAALTTLMAKIIMFFMSAYYSFKDHLRLKDFVTHDHVLVSSFCGSALILVVGTIVQSLFHNILLQLLGTFGIGIIVYMIVLALFKNPLLLSLIDRLKLKFLR